MDLKNRITKEETFMRMAETIAQRSTCKRLQVGSLVVDKDLNRVLSCGYNGNYIGGPNTCDSDEPGSCGDIHSEVNALVKSGFESDRIMFLTDSPCLMCAKLMINSGIKKLYYRKEYRITDGLKLLENSGIETIKL